MPMTSEDLLKFAEDLGLGPKELAHLVGVSVRTLRRGVKAGGTVDTLVKGLQEGLANPRTHLSVRALAIISARGDGLKALVARMVHAYVTMDELRRT